MNTIKVIQPRMGTTIPYDKQPQIVQYSKIRVSIIASSYAESMGTEFYKRGLPYPDLLRHYASMGEVMPPEEEQRLIPVPAQAPIAANAALGIAAVAGRPAIPINLLGGLNDTNSPIKTYEQVYGDLPATHLRMEAVKELAAKQTFLSTTNASLKNALLEVLDSSIIERLQTQMPGPGVKNWAQMSSKEVLNACDEEFRPRSHADIMATKSWILNRFSTTDLQSSKTLDLAVNLKIQYMAMLPDYARPTPASHMAEWQDVFTATPPLTQVHAEFVHDNPDPLEQTLERYRTTVQRFYDSKLALQGGMSLATTSGTKGNGGASNAGGGTTPAHNANPNACMYWLMGQKCTQPRTKCAEKFTHITEQYGVGRVFARLLTPKEDKLIPDNKMRNGRGRSTDRQDNRKQPSSNQRANPRGRSGTPGRARANSTNEEEVTDDHDDDESVNTAVTANN